MIRFRAALDRAPHTARIRRSPRDAAHAQCRERRNVFWFESTHTCKSAWVGGRRRVHNCRRRDDYKGRQAYSANNAARRLRVTGHFISTGLERSKQSARLGNSPTQNSGCTCTPRGALLVLGALLPVLSSVTSRIYRLTHARAAAAAACSSATRAAPAAPPSVRRSHCDERFAKRVHESRKPAKAVSRAARTSAVAQARAATSGARPASGVPAAACAACRGAIDGRPRAAARAGERSKLPSAACGGAEGKGRGEPHSHAV